MSKILYVCYRKIPIDEKIENKLKIICDELSPSNITSRNSLIHREKNIIFGINNPTSTIKTKSLNVLLGKIFGEENSWHEPLNEYPDGNYAIFRANKNVLEIVTDCLGTRSIWYYFDEEIIIASTSQKAIIKYLGRFKFDEGLIPWMLSTGSLGPNNSWDKRLKKVPADGSVIVDRSSWQISVKSGKVEFVPVKISEKESKKLLQNALLETFSSINLGMDKWAVTLSGGHDSRAVLFLLQKFKTYKSPLRTITWGAEDSLKDAGSDACVAKEVGKVLGSNHSFFPTEHPPDSLETIISRFLNNGEGRIDHIPAYLDGFKLWKRIFEAGIEGIIRGDEIFGYNRIYSPLVVKSFMGLTLCSDYHNLKKYEYLQSLDQEMPENLKQKKNESLSTWRDRIFQLYRIPYIQSSLGDIKYPYIEQINPFLSRRILNVIRKMPDRHRTEKRLFKLVMKQWDLGVPFAKRASTIKFKDVLRQEKLVELIKQELNSEYARRIFPQQFLEEVIENLKIKRNETNKKLSFFEKIKRLIPQRIKAYIAQQKPSLHLDDNILAFRIFIISRMHKELNS